MAYGQPIYVPNNNPWQQMLPQMLSQMVMMKMRQSFAKDQLEAQREAWAQQAKLKSDLEDQQALKDAAAEDFEIEKIISEGPPISEEGQKAAGIAEVFFDRGTKSWKWIKKAPPPKPTKPPEKEWRTIVAGDNDKYGYTKGDIYGLRGEETKLIKAAKVTEETPPKEKKPNYFETPEKLVDDTRGYYQILMKTMLDDMGFVKQGKEEEYRKLTERMDNDFKLIAEGKRPSWLGNNAMAASTLPEKLTEDMLKRYQDMYPGRSVEEIIEAWQNQ